MDQPPWVMVVDDDPDVRELLCCVLELEGYRVSCAADGSAVLRLLAMDQRPDLVLLDLLMPGVNGLAVLSLLTTARPPLRVVAISASRDALIQARTAPICGRLVKPFRLDELLGIVAAQVGPPVQPASA